MRSLQGHVNADGPRSTSWPAPPGLPGGLAGEGAVRSYDALLARIKRAATCRVYGYQDAPLGGERFELVLVRIPARTVTSQGRRRRVALNGGTHGDEPAGVEAVTQFLERRLYDRWPHVEFTITPCINPWGYVYDRRAGPRGADLNRCFRRARRSTPEVALLKRALGPRRFDLFIDCHEDVDAPGLYVYAPTALGRSIVAAAGALGPLHPGPLVDGEIPLVGAVAALDRPAAGSAPAPEPAVTARGAPWPLPAGSWAASLPPPDVGQLATATVETPTALPLEQRVAMHLASITAAIDSL
ncbi:MAG TPA: succinylglutamate desuccinylase/aspartoacylase family protein [Chloroflexota bacterium]|jgi:protein MpaA|nr:succinylglutamate desuccinylase/aspartoacylase family protein [Chloroflexota bacterium]